MGLDCMVYRVKNNQCTMVEDEIYYWRKNWEMYHFFRREFDKYGDKNHSWEMFNVINGSVIDYETFLKYCESYSDIPTEITKETMERLKKEYSSFDVDNTLFESKRRMNEDFKNFENAVEEAFSNGYRLYFFGDY